jgi:hypothetical protein
LQNIFSENFGENIGVFAQTTASFCHITLVFEKNANYVAENSQKSQKIGKNRIKLAKIIGKL